MKKALFFFSILAALMLFGGTQAKAQRPTEEPTVIDSLVNQDTVVYEFPYTFKKPYWYSITVQADSVSGANAGSVYVEFTNDRTASTTRWHRSHTLTSDGTGTTEDLFQNPLYARRVRIYAISPAGTRKVRLYIYATFKATN